MGNSIHITTKDMEETKELKVIDVLDLIKKVYRHKKLFYRTVPITFVLSCLFIICIPRTYTCEIKLAPESNGLSSGGSLSSVASAFGLDGIGKLSGDDAISPELYPDLMNSTDFTTSLFNVNVVSKDGTINTNYYDYMQFHQKAAWWNIAIEYVKSLFSSDDEPATSFGTSEVNPFMLTRRQQRIAEAMQGSISCKVDKKTDVISIRVVDQDPLICATIADTVRTRLQKFITDYRTNKARTDLKYYEALYLDAKKNYENTRELYVKYSDANQGLVLEKYKSAKEDIENEMQLKYNSYSMVSNQLQAARYKVQEQTPAFTILQGASVPIKPAAPKRMIFVAVMVILAFVITSAYICVVHKE